MERRVSRPRGYRGAGEGRSWDITLVRAGWQGIVIIGAGAGAGANVAVVMRTMLVLVARRSLSLYRTLLSLLPHTCLLYCTGLYSTLYSTCIDVSLCYGALLVFKELLL